MGGFLQDDGDDVILKGNTDQTLIGNVTDRLKVIDEDAIAVLQTISLGVNPVADVFKHAEQAVSSRNAFDLTGTSYTVPTGKQFVLTSFSGSYDAQAALYIRLLKQTGGAGAWETLFRLNMMSGGQGNSTICFNIGDGIIVAQAGDILKLQVESSIAKGTVWAEYSGSNL